MPLFLTGTALCCAAAFLCCRLRRRTQENLLNVLAAVLPLSELGKQLLLYRSAGCSYVWWYFPFQLCSLPLYLLPLRQLLLFRPAKAGKAAAFLPVLTDFLADFSLLGGLFSFADQTGMHYALPVLTLHSYLWHFVLIFLGVFLILSGRHSRTLRRWLSVQKLFLACVLLAELINALAHTQGAINMFYLSPWEPVTQIVFRQIAAVLGKGPELLLYLFALLAGGFLVHAAACAIKPFH